MAIKARYYTWGLIPNETELQNPLAGSLPTYNTNAQIANMTLYNWRHPIYVADQNGNATLDFVSYAERGGTVGFTTSRPTYTASDILSGDITQLFVGENNYTKQCSYGDTVDVSFEQTTLQNGQVKISCLVPEPDLQNYTGLNIPFSLSARVVKDIALQGFVRSNYDVASDYIVDPVRGEQYQIQSVNNVESRVYLGLSSFLVGTSYELPTQTPHTPWVNEMIWLPDGTSTNRYKDGSNWKVGTSQDAETAWYCGLRGQWHYASYATQISSIQFETVQFEQLGKPQTALLNSRTWLKVDFQANQDVLDSITLVRDAGVFSQNYVFYNANGIEQAKKNKGWLDLLLEYVGGTVQQLAIEKYGTGSYVEIENTTSLSGCPPGAIVSFAYKKEYYRPTLSLYLDRADKNGTSSWEFWGNKDYSIIRKAYSTPNGETPYGDRYGNLEFYEVADEIEPEEN